MPMKNPPHPGCSIKDSCLEPLGLSVTTAAKALGIARHTLSRVSMAMPEFLLIWPSALKRPDGRTLTIGYGCKLPMTSPKLASMNAILK